jgi:hypothetical protein
LQRHDDGEDDAVDGQVQWRRDQQDGPQERVGEDEPDAFEHGRAVPAGWFVTGFLQRAPDQRHADQRHQEGDRVAEER